MQYTDLSQRGVGGLAPPSTTQQLAAWGLLAAIGGQRPAAGSSQRADRPGDHNWLWLWLSQSTVTHYPDPIRGCDPVVLYMHYIHGGISFKGVLRKDEYGSLGAPG